MEEYPKTVTLKDKSKVTLRLMTAEDQERLLDFFRGLAEEDRLFLKEDVTNPEIIRRWIRRLDYDRVLPVLAEAEGRIVGNATLHRKRGWSSHVGEIRCVVASEYQGRGLGTILAHELFHEAMVRGMEKIVARMMDSQIGAQKAFEKLGFQKEATLKGHVTDRKGSRHDLLILSNDPAHLWQKIENRILDLDLRIDAAQ